MAVACAKPHKMNLTLANWNWNRVDLGCAPVPNAAPLAPSDLRTIPLPDGWNQTTSISLNQGNTEYFPPFPQTLRTLTAEKNQLRELPDLPQSLTALNVSHNNLTKLPKLPNNLTHLTVEHNQLQKIDGFPNTLQRFKAKHNQLTEIGSLANTQVSSVGLGFNNLTKLPDFPQTLANLGFPDNQVREVKNLPNGVEVLNCSNNPIQRMQIDNLTSLRIVIASNCGLTELPLLPESRIAGTQKQKDDDEDYRDYLFENNPLSPAFAAIYTRFQQNSGFQQYTDEDGIERWSRRRPGATREFREAILEEHRRLVAERKGSATAIQQV
jgi:hypothetical protein